MTNDGFLSTASVVAILVAVAVLAVASALALAPLNEPLRRRSTAAFGVCLLAAWIVTSFIIALIRDAI